MAIKSNKPFRNVGVGAMYYCFATAIDPLAYETDVHKAATVASIGTTENSTSENVWASNAIYDKTESTTGIDLSVEVVAFAAPHRAKMKGHTVTRGFLVKNSYDEGAYFGFGVVYPKKNGNAKYVWYPKCRLTEANEEAQTKNDDGDNAQNKTLVIQAMPFNNDGDYEIEYDTELLAEGDDTYTEDEFFAAVLLEVPPVEGGGA